MRKNLYVFRHDVFRHGRKLSQADIADRVGCTRASYAAIEQGIRNGRESFWEALKREFNLTKKELAELRELDEIKKPNDND